VDKALVAGHVGAVALAGVSVWRERGVGAGQMVRMMMAVLALTAVTGVKALVESREWIWSLIYMVEQVGVLIVGGVWGKKWMVVWGVVGVVIGVFYYTAYLTVVWLTMLGLILIGVVVWRLMVGKK
jgi:hypothetical protein